MLEEYYYPIPFLPKICGLNLKQSNFCVGGSLHLKLKLSFCSVKRPGKVILQLDLIDLSLVKFKISGPLFVDIVQNLPGRWNLTIIAEIYRQFPLIPTNRNVWIIPPGAGQSRFLGPCPFTARCRSLKIPRQQGEEWLAARADDEWRKLKLPPLVSLQLLQLWPALFPSSSHFPFLILDLHLSLHWLAWCWKLRLPSHLLFRSERERVVGETFVCKTCRGRSIHPFQKNNITFKWNSLEPPNPIFEPRSLSRTFPFWIFHSQQEEEGSTSHWGLPPVHSIRKMQELPWSLLSALHRCENSTGFSPENVRIWNFSHVFLLWWKNLLEYWWRDSILALGSDVLNWE